MSNPSARRLRPTSSAAIDFYKYSVCGNVFVLVDELHGRQLSESEKSVFAGFAIDEYFGIGCDNLIFLQRFSNDLMRYIGNYRGYWSEHPQEQNAVADFVFRMFEPDGTEAFCCGNGLLCIAHHLYRQYGIEAAGILTEVPSCHPEIRRLEVMQPTGACCVNMGPVTPLPSWFATQGTVSSGDGAVSIAHDLPISFKVKALDGTLHNFRSSLQGFLVYSGEPHLVILDNQESFMKAGLEACKRPADSSIDHLGTDHTEGENESESIQLDMHSTIQAILNDYKECERDNPDSIYCVRLLRQIGLCLNGDDSRLFPQGINVNFVRILDADEGIVEYRCFERGIRKETLACGTGAVAVAATLHQYGLVNSHTVRLWPKSSRIHDPLAELRVSQDGAGNWWLEGAPRLVFSGCFELPAAAFPDLQSIASPTALPLGASMKEQISAQEIHR